MYFGTDVSAALQAWWEAEFFAVLERKYSGSTLAVLVLQPSHEPSWSTPEAGEVLLRCSFGVPTAEDLLENIHHKLRFVLRTGLDSSQAQGHLHLVEPGDFPHGGAVRYRGFVGGASGLHEESDVWVVQRVIDRIVEVRQEIAAGALRASAAHLEGWKFLPDAVPPDDVDGGPR